jgi:hypothetical protein
MEPMHHHREGPANPGTAVVEFGHLTHDVFRDPVSRPNYDRAKWNKMGITSTAVVHGDVKEPGRTECLNSRRNLFEMPAKRLLTFVEATNDLTVGPINPSRPTLAGRGDGIFTPRPCTQGRGMSISPAPGRRGEKFTIRMDRECVQYLDAIPPLEREL